MCVSLQPSIHGRHMYLSESSESEVASAACYQAVNHWDPGNISADVVASLNV